jgi:uncharacterized membrane protein YgcG
MQNPKAGQRKGVKFAEIKILIATLSVVVILGIWNLLSNEAVQAEKIVPAPVVSPPSADFSTDPQVDSPLPTVVPLVDVTTITSAVAVQQPVSNQPVKPSVLPLRAVAAPTQVIVQKYKPVVEQQVQVISSGGGGGGGGGSSSGGGGGSAPAPVTTTRSSHP